MSGNNSGAEKSSSSVLGGPASMGGWEELWEGGNHDFSGKLEKEIDPTEPETDVDPEQYGDQYELPRFEPSIYMPSQVGFVPEGYSIMMRQYANTRNAELESPYSHQGPKKLNILCLDGGGVRGLSALFILKDLMEQLNLRHGESEESKLLPCDVFDLIGGTSTGGIIAILLGRLRLDVAECIRLYKNFFEPLYKGLGERKYQYHDPFLAFSVFDAKALQKGIVAMLKDSGCSEDESLEEDSQKCKVAVFAVQKITERPTLLRSYDIRNLMIWEAARATLAASEFFPPFTSQENEDFVAGTSALNPVALLWDEAKAIFGGDGRHLEDRLGCFISIGTGSGGLESVEPELLKDSPGRDKQRHLATSGKYYRFNVDHLRGVGLDDINDECRVAATTREYMRHIESREASRNCVLALDSSRSLYGEASLPILSRPAQPFDISHRIVDDQSVPRVSDPWNIQSFETQGQYGDFEATYRTKPSIPEYNFRARDRTEFQAGQIIRLRWFDDDEQSNTTNEEQKDSDLSDSEEFDFDAFLLKRRNRQGKVRMFVVCKAYHDYSLAVPLKQYLSPPPLPDRMCCATVTTNHTSSINKGPGALPPIHISLDKHVRYELSNEVLDDSWLFYTSPPEIDNHSVINYADVFTIEHNTPLEFIGHIEEHAWDSFRKSYEQVQQKKNGFSVPDLPTRSGKRPSDPMQSSPLPTDFIQSSLLPYSYSNTAMQVQSASELYFDEPADLQSNTPGFSNFVEGRDKHKRDRQASHFGSQVPIRQQSLVNAELGSSFALQTIEVERPSYNSSSLYQCGYSDLEIGDGCVSQTPKAAELSQICNSLDWIKSLTQFRENLMAQVLGPGQTVESLCSLSEEPGSSIFTASRVKVAILDSNVNLDTDVFNHHRERTKCHFKDFIGDGQKAEHNTHGTHVAALLLHIAPEAEVFVARCTDNRDRMADAIWHAIREWKVDIISISAGFNQLHEEMEIALDSAYAAGICVFAATHNDGLNSQVAFPARYKTVHGISSTDHNGKPSKTAAEPLPNKINYATLGENIDAFWMAPLAESLRAKEAASNSTSRRLTRRNQRQQQLRTKEKLTQLMSPVSGSSFSTPIAAGAFATTLLCARLIYHLEPKRPYAGLLGRHTIKDLLLNKLAGENACQRHPGYVYLKPSFLWSDRFVKTEIIRLVARSKEGR